WNKRVSTAKLNRWLEFQTQGHPPPAVSGRRIKLKYMTQIKSRPPGFIISSSRPEALPESYTRYLMNGLRDDFGFTGVPIRISYRGTVNPFEGRANKRK
ncbi:MAG: engA, partial [Rhizobium sp.]|nr:engA [Rhizobium sp.]